jgi:hypothetical protein
MFQRAKRFITFVSIPNINGLLFERGVGAKVGSDQFSNRWNPGECGVKL